MADTPSAGQAGDPCGSSRPQSDAAGSTPPPEPAPAPAAAAASHGEPAALMAAGPAEPAALVNADTGAAPATIEGQVQGPAEAGAVLLALRPGLRVTLDLEGVLEHCKCSICMGIIKNTRAVSACMHRFCKDCIEAWLRTQIENNCPQCRIKFSSKRDCKPDPNFDLLLGAMFGDIRDFEERMLDPSVEVLEAARAVGHQIARVKMQAAARRPSPSHAQRQQSVQQPSTSEQQQQPQPAQMPPEQQVQGPDAAAAPPQAAAPAQQGADGTVRVTSRGRGQPGGSKRGAPPAASEAKRLKLNLGDEDETGAGQYRGVRFQGDNWQARTKRAGKEVSLGLYNTAEEAGMAYDLDRLQQQGGKAQRLNFPLLRQHYKQILADLADLQAPDGMLDFLAVAVQAAVKAARSVPGAPVPEEGGFDATSAPARRTNAHAAANGGGSEGGVSAAAGGVRSHGGAAQGVQAAAVALEVDAAVAEQHALAAQRAEQLAVERSLEAGLASGVAHVRLQAGGSLSWRMAYLGCPAGATIAQLSEAVVLGLSQQHGLAAGALAVGLSVANDLDASADFDALCREDSGTGNLLLQGHVTVRDLLSMLENPLEDLALEYHAAVTGRSEGSPPAVLPMAVAAG